MARILVRLVDPQTGEGVLGRYSLTPLPLPGSGPWVEGRDLRLPDRREGTLLASSLSSINNVPVLPHGWYYSFEGWSSEDPLVKVTASFILTEDRDWLFEDLPFIDPCDPESLERPEPVWWRALTSVQESMDDAVSSAEDAATRAEAAASTWVGFSDDPTYRVLVTKEDGERLIVHGDPSAVNVHGVASITKVMTCLVLAEFLEGSSQFSWGGSSVQVISFDRQHQSPDSRLLAGDSTTLRDLAALSLIASDNTAPNVIARFVGTRLYIEKHGSAPPSGWEGNRLAYGEFVRAMNEKAVDLFPGMAGSSYWGQDSTASFSQAVGAGRMSPDQITRLMWSADGHGELRALMEASSYQWTRNRDGQSTSITISSLINRERFPEARSYKGGTSFSRGHSALIWEHEGERYCAVVQDVPLSNYPVDRFDVLERALDFTKVGGVSFNPGYTFQSGKIDFSTGLLDITESLMEIHPELERIPDVSDAGVFLERDGYQCALYITGMRMLGPERIFPSVIPVGFHPKVAAWSMLHAIPSGGGPNARRAGVTISGNIRIDARSDETQEIRGEIRWTTEQLYRPAPWPGIPVRRL